MYVLLIVCINVYSLVECNEEKTNKSNETDDNEPQKQRTKLNNQNKELQNPSLITVGTSDSVRHSESFI